MNKVIYTRLSRSLLCSAAAIALGLSVQTASAQEEEEEDESRQKIILVTGTRIQQPGTESASPISTIGAQEIEFQQVAEVEKLIRNLPVTIPGDGQNVNNGTAGATTIDLRGLGAQRNLVLIDGKRMIPFDVDGQVDVSTIPLSMLERIDVITGGASAVYGSDAMAGAVNFILKRDFEGIEFDADYQITGDSDGDIYTASLTMGSNLDDGRGNVTFGLNYTNREGVQLAARDFGLFGVDTETGDGASGTPAASPAQCANEGTTAQSGSTTSIPGRLDLVTGQLQFNNDGTLGASCNRFNFNPFNYYQTPQERVSGTAIGYYDINPDVQAYGRLLYSAINVDQQVAPSGVFGNQFLIPLMNPFISQSARDTILTTTNTFLAANPTLGLSDVNVTDNNANGVFDAADSITAGVRRRTVELGPRSTSYDSNQYQFMIGLRGDIMDSWDWDISYQHGEVDKVLTNTGYTNVSNIAIALNTVDANSCITPQGVTTAGCVPIDIFGSLGSITAAAAPFSSAIGVQQDKYSQDIFSASISGPWDAVISPFADTPVALAFGTEYRQEIGETIPDECLKELPSSCLGGAGGNVLPVKGGYDVYEFFGEAIAPLATDQPWAKSLDLELGYRYSDYDPSGVNETWKAGASWEVFDGFRLRGMRQRAARAPNVGEIASPVVTGLDNAVSDPCSVTNAGNIDAALSALCVSTGVLPALVGIVPDITAGQINAFTGTNPLAPPEPEEADTTTFGFVWSPALGENILRPLITVDYYDIDISNTIGEFSAQEALDGCYIDADPAFCALMVRVNGSFAAPSSGVQLFTTNLEFLRAEGIEVGLRGGIDLQERGEITASFNSNFYLTNESQSTPTSEVIDCLGRFGTACDPTPEFRFIQRTTWSYGDFEVSYLWRYLGEVELLDNEKAGVFDGFENIDAFNYIDFSGAYDINDNVRLSASLTNAFDEDPPIIGNDTGQTDANSGNTFPSFYDTLGRVYAVGINVRF